MSTKTIVTAALLFSACATTGTPSTFGTEGARTGSRVQLDLVPHADAARVFPAAIDPRLPRADRLATQILSTLGDTASLEVRLCVAPQGTVASVEVLRGSSLAAFDQSVIADAMGWQFEALPGPTGVKTCERATITYHPHG
jgi:TonB family protein